MSGVNTSDQRISAGSPWDGSQWPALADVTMRTCSVQPTGPPLSPPHVPGLPPKVCASSVLTEQHPIFGRTVIVLVLFVALSKHRAYGRGFRAFVVREPGLTSLLCSP